MLKKYTWEEVAKHNKKDDCWIIINLKVYDVTKYIELHPGGSGSILQHAGKDDNRDFDNQGHTPKATTILDKYIVGTVPAKQEKSSSACVVS